MFVKRWTATIIIGLFLVIGCSGGGNPAAPPDGWQATETRWWEEGLDTAMVFKDLESLSSMGIIEESAQLTAGNVSRDQFNAAIKKSLVRLYRNNPAIVDSLFNEYAAPKLESVDLSSGVLGKNGKMKPKILQKNKKAAYEAVTEYFREPQRQKDANLVYPDSLRRDEEASGEVQLQVHIDSTGAVDAVEVLDGVHPTLDAIAMKAATRTAWQPAYLLVNDEWRPRPSWARFSVNYPAPQ